MNLDQDQKSERILDLTLEIIYLLTGEDYIIMKKPGEIETSTSCPCRTQSPSLEPSPHYTIHERDDDEKILHLTNKNMHQIAGEVPIRCEDVAVYLSIEEWEYLEGHKDLYNDVMMEDTHPLSTLATLFFSSVSKADV
ncbi:gastrula zinc finger protein XlCGF66.1-like [Pelodytes ibericus]